MRVMGDPLMVLRVAGLTTGRSLFGVFVTGSIRMALHAGEKPMLRFLIIPLMEQPGGCFPPLSRVLQTMAGETEGAFSP